MKTHVRMGVWFYAFIISTLDGSEWSFSHLGHFSVEETPRYPLDSCGGSQTQESNSGYSSSSPVTILTEPSLPLQTTGFLKLQIATGAALSLDVKHRSDHSPQCSIDVNVWSLISFSLLRLPAFFTGTT
jgi:hypothetical protein